MPTLSEGISTDNKPSDFDSDDYESVTSETEPIYPLFLAKYDYTAMSDHDMSFKRGDQLLIINTDNQDWWFARAKHSGQEGSVPSNYITKSPLDMEE